MTDRTFIEKGASAHFELGYDGPSQPFYFLLLPKTTMLAIAAAIEPLRIANQITERELYTWHTLTEDGAAVTCSNGMRITPDGDLASVTGTARCFVCAGVEPESSASEAVLGWIRREARFGRRFGGICTGAYALAKAGLIGKRRFTLHWENQQGFREAFPKLDPSLSLYEDDDGLITCGGGNAATDMMLSLVEAQHGTRLATVIADMCLHSRAVDPSTPQTTARSAAIGSRNRNLIAALELMEREIEEPLAMDDICEELRISRRQLERLFLRHLGETPMAHYLGLRLARALGYLRETNMTTAEIAVATGFSSSNHFARRFKERYGRTPREYRQSWA